MVNTLRITSVVAVIAAVVLLALVVGPRSALPKLLMKYAVGGDEEVKRILDAPGVVERFREDQGDQNVTQKDVTPPLVKQAETLAKILNPPKAPSTTSKTTGGGRRPPIPPRPVASTAKFALVGTSYLASEPDSSFAYISLPDKTVQWVRKGDSVGHLLVKEIRNGSILYYDGQRDVEMSTEPMPDTANLLEASAGAATVQANPARPTPRSPGGRITGPAKPTAPRPWSPGRNRTALDRSKDPAERKAMEDLVARLKASNEPGSNVSTEERAAIMRELMADLRSSRTGAEDTKKVEDLGRELNEAQKANPNDKRSNLRRKLTIPK